MKEFVNCESCNASVEIHEITCDYCGSEFKLGRVNSEILMLKEQLDKMFYTADFQEIVRKVDSSRYKDHPVLLFRKAKALLVVYMTNDGIIDSHEFIEVVKMMMSLANLSQDYWSEFILYLTVLFPSSHTKLFLDDYQVILAFLSSNDLDREKVVEQKLLQQVIMSVAGETFIKEYNYFTNEKNFFNSKDFILKRDYLKTKYQEIEKSIINNQNE